MDKDLLHKKAIREIVALIASGDFVEGQRLPAERKLCEQFGISRGTLRKALIGLEKMGVIEIRPQSGAYIKNFSYKKLPTQLLPADCKKTTIQDVIIARKAIETAAIELACDKVTQEDLVLFEDYIFGMEQSVDDIPEYLYYDIKFHEHIVKSSLNPVLITAFEAIAEYHKYSQVFSSGYETCEEDSLVYHKKILTALKDGNKKACIRLIKLHLDSMT